MRDCYSDNLGDGWVRHHDYGFITMTRYGQEYVECECGKLFPESEADDRDGLCVECHNYQHECQECGQMFDDVLETIDGFPTCQECIDKLDALANIKPIARIDMVDLARKCAGIGRAV